MKLVSVNVGVPREVPWKGRVVTTAIFKEPVAGRVAVRPHNLDGDRQADLQVHGGAYKAVYAYPIEHYAFWRRELPEMDLPFGMFGENLTTEGLGEADVNVGDRFRVGSAELVATEPRFPCYKLGLRFGRDDILKRFLASARSGFYFAVARAGELGAGDAIEPLSRDAYGLTIADVVRLYAHGRNDAAGLRRAVEAPGLSASWREHFREQLERLA